jgi:hypothetical protein
MNRNFTSVKKIYDFLNQHIGYEIVKNDITSSVPLDPANTDYQEIQKWIAEGGEVIDNPRSDNPRSDNPRSDNPPTE